MSSFERRKANRTYSTVFQFSALSFTRWVLRTFKPEVIRSIFFGEAHARLIYTVRKFKYGTENIGDFDYFPHVAQSPVVFRNEFSAYSLDTTVTKGYWVRSRSRIERDPDLVVYFVPGNMAGCTSSYAYIEFLSMLLVELQVQGFRNPAVYCLDYNYFSHTGKGFENFLLEVANGWQIASTTYSHVKTLFMGSGIGATAQLSLLLHIARPTSGLMPMCYVNRQFDATMPSAIHHTNFEVSKQEEVSELIYGEEESSLAVKDEEMNEQAYLSHTRSSQLSSSQLSSSRSANSQHAGSQSNSFETINSTSSQLSSSQSANSDSANSDSANSGSANSQSANSQLSANSQSANSQLSANSRSPSPSPLNSFRGSGSALPIPDLLDKTSRSSTSLNNAFKLDVELQSPVLKSSPVSTPTPNNSGTSEQVTNSFNHLQQCPSSLPDEITDIYNSSVSELTAESMSELLPEFDLEEIDFPVMRKPDGLVLISPLSRVKIARKNRFPDFMVNEALSHLDEVLHKNDGGYETPCSMPGCITDSTWWEEAVPARGISVFYGGNETQRPEIEQLIRHISSCRNPRVVTNFRDEEVHAWPITNAFTARTTTDQIDGISQLSDAVAKMLAYDCMFANSSVIKG